MSKLFGCLWAILVGFVVFSCVLVCTSCDQDRQDRVEECFNGCPQEEVVEPEVIVVPLPGKDGESCTVMEVAEGVTVRCGEIAAFIEKGAKGDQGDRGDTGVAGDRGGDGVNGRDGADGKDGVDADPVRAVTLCGSTSPHAEIALKIGDIWIAYLKTEMDRTAA